MDTHTLLAHLARLLREAYEALPAQDQDGPLGDRIIAALHEAIEVLKPEVAP
ncbi:MAG TPA: hypothetical protein VF077_12340 [Nitrospiraceae bacterium]